MTQLESYVGVAPKIQFLEYLGFFQQIANFRYSYPKQMFHIKAKMHEKFHFLVNTKKL